MITDHERYPVRSQRIRKHLRRANQLSWRNSIACIPAGSSREPAKQAAASSLVEALRRLPQHRPEPAGVDHGLEGGS